MKAPTGKLALAYRSIAVAEERAERFMAERDALQALLNERDEKLARYAEFLAWCESAPVSSGVCCCGDNMESHGHYADHGAVDEWDHSLGNWAKELRP